MKAMRFVLACALALAGAAAQAHAFLDRAEPRVGATVSVAPVEVRLWFTQELEPAFCTVEVTDAQGHRADAGKVLVDAQDRALLHVPLAKLAPGAYTAKWRIVSVDTHVTDGRFVFRVGP